MLKIRLLRVGRKHHPSFRLVVTDSKKAPQSSAYLENLGFYEPRQGNFELKSERVNYWISKGAQLSDTARNLLIKARVITGKKIDVASKKKKKKFAEEKPTEAKVETMSKKIEKMEEIKEEERPAETKEDMTAQQELERKKEKKAEGKE